MYPKDKYLVPLAVPFISATVTALNNEPLYILVSRAWFWRDFAAGCAIGAVVWLCIRQISILLDQRSNWKEAFYKRLLRQAFWGWLMPSLLLFGLCWLLFELLIGQPFFESYFPYYEYPFSVLLLALINVYYMVTALLQKDSSSAGIKKEVIMAVKGADVYPLKPEMIRVVIKNNTQLDVYTADGQRFSLSGTLDALEKTLSEPVFFRINRQTILHISAIRSFRAVANGKIEINSGFGPAEPILVSQKKAAGFRRWIGTGSGS